MNFQLILSIFLLLSIAIHSQPTWEREANQEEADLLLFHSVMTPNFPTTETLQQGDFHYEISHRFLPPVKEGFDTNFGFDSPVRMRTVLSYGLTNDLMITLGRSSNLDNWDLQLKYTLLQIRHETFPGALAVRGGLAWNSEKQTGLDRDRFDSRKFQYYMQAVYNAMFLDKKLGIGVVPSYLYNSTIFSLKIQDTFTLGNYYQYYFNHKVERLAGIQSDYRRLSGHHGTR